MFSVNIITTEGFEKVVLTDTASEAIAEIIPSCGAILHAFCIQHHGKRVDVIDHYDDAADFKDHCASKGFKGCKLSPFVCRLKNGEYPFGKSIYKTGRSYQGNNAIHGLLFDAEFFITGHHAGPEKAGIELKHEYRGEDAGYPFHYDCVVSYTLGERNALAITTTIINRDMGIIPVADGWHPYFTFGGKIDDLQLEFQSRAMLEFDDELIPTGKLLPYEEFGSLKKISDTFFDNCFLLDLSECQPLCVLRDAAQKIQVEIRPDIAYPYLQVYTPPHRNSIAIENLSSAPDAFNNGMGLLTLTPGASVSFKTTYTISSLT